MYKLAIPFVLAIAPAAVLAQASAQANANASTNAHARVGGVEASSATSVDAEIAIARRRGIPTRPIENRVAEGRAKGAAETRLAMVAAETRANMETALQALIDGGRRRPSDDEVERGGEVIARGYSRADVEAVVRSAPGDRSLVVAFDVLSELRARGVASARAIAQVQSKLQARASDGQIQSLVSAGADVSGRAVSGATGSATGATANVGAGAAATVRGTTGITGATAGVTGTVKGVIKP